MYKNILNNKSGTFKQWHSIYSNIAVFLNSLYVRVLSEFVPIGTVHPQLRHC